LFHDDGNELKNLGHNFNHPGILLEQKEALESLFQHINALPDNQKTALILSKLEQKSQKEVAEIMKLSTKAVESLLQRAKTNLAKKINPSEGK
jgi:RNA polymerase sigma-70 factor (ECF subfamily)